MISWRYVTIRALKTWREHKTSMANDVDYYYGALGMVSPGSIACVSGLGSLSEWSFAQWTSIDVRVDYRRRS